MSPAALTARRRAARAVRWLIAAALGGLAVTAAAAAQAQAAGPAAAARTGAASSAPQPIPVNTQNWSASAGFGSRPPAWYLDGSGVVHLQGAAKQIKASGADRTTIGTLPPAAAPSWTIYTVVITDPGTYADLAIEPDGTIALIDPRSPAVRDEGFVSLESISYRR
jgi:hypothetical protein